MREPQTVLENITCMYAYQGMLTCNQPATRFTTIYHNLPRFTTIYHSLPQFTTAEVVAVAWHGRTVVCVNHEFSIQNDEFCISNDRFCISNDEFRTDLCGIFPARSALSSAGCQPLASGVPSGSSRSCQRMYRAALCGASYIEVGATSPAPGGRAAPAAGSANRRRADSQTGCGRRVGPRLGVCRRTLINK